MVFEAAAMVGVGLFSFGIYGLWNKIDDGKNKLCDYTELNSLMGDGIQLSKHVRLSVKASNTHILMIAPSESGKSWKFLIPNINNDKLKNCSIIVTDPSGEIKRYCKTNKIKYILNPFSDNTFGYDFLKNCRSEFEVKKIARVILTNGMANGDNGSNINQKEWVDMSSPLLSSYMLMNYALKRYTFDEMIKRICILPIMQKVDRDENGKVIKVYPSIQQEIIESGVESAITEFLAFSVQKEAVATMSSSRSVLNCCLQVFLDTNLKKMFKKPSIDISKIRMEESIIYIQIPEHHSEYFSPFVATFLTQLFDYLLENDGLQTYFLFDEFANCGLIPSICKLLSTARKHNISIVAAIQSLIQLSSIYGETQGKELTDLFKTVMICNGLKDSTEYISNLLGVEEYNENNTIKTRPLMTPDEVRRLKDDKMIIITKNKRPVIDEMMEISK